MALKPTTETETEAETSEGQISHAGSFQMRAEGNERERLRGKKMTLEMEMDTLVSSLKVATVKQQPGIEQAIQQLDLEIQNIKSQIETPEVDIGMDM